MSDTKQAQGHKAQGRKLGEGATPGPWLVQQLNHVNGDLWLQIGWRDGAREIGPVAELLPVARLKYLIAPEAEQRANARLAAAAPELLAMVRELRDALEDARAEVAHLNVPAEERHTPWEAAYDDDARALLVARATALLGED